MKNYYLYFFLTALFPLSILYVFGLEIYHDNAMYRYSLGYSFVYLGILQLITGFVLLAYYNEFPKWVGKGIRNYWIFTISFFVFWLAYFQWMFIPMPVFVLLSFAAAKGIAIYQFVLICRMAALRKRQLEKRAFLQIYSH